MPRSVVESLRLRWSVDFILASLAFAGHKNFVIVFHVFLSFIIV